MSGEPCNWEESDAASFGEGVPYCAYPGCRAPLELHIGVTIVFERCRERHISHAQLVYPEDFAAA